MDKNEVRQLIMNRRHELSDEDIEMQSGLIIDRLKKSDIYKTSENAFPPDPDSDGSRKCISVYEL